MKLKQRYHLLCLIGTFFLSLSAHNVLNTPFSFGNKSPDYRQHRQQLRSLSQSHAISAQTQASQSYPSSQHVPTEQEKQEAQRAQQEKKYRKAMQKREDRKRFWYKCAILWKKTCNIFTFHSTNCGIQSITEQYYGTSDNTQQQLPAQEPAPALQKNNTQASQAIITQTIKEHMPAIKQTFDRFQSTLTQQPDLATVDRYLNRLQALQEAGGDPHKAIACEYTVNQQAQELLAKQGVDLDDVTQFYGTPLQQVIHGEYVDWLNAVADEQVPPECAELMEGLHDIHQGGMELNKQGLVAPAMTVSDFLWESLGVLRGAAYGAGDSIAGLTHMVAHPIQTTKDLTYTCFMAGYLYGTFLRECLTVLVMSFDDPDEAIAYRDGHVAVLWDAAKQGLDAVKNLSQEEKARHASRVAADIFVAPKIAKGCTKLAGLAAGTCGSALSELSDLANFMDLVPGAAMLQDAQTAKKAQKALAVVTEFEQRFDMPNKYKALAQAISSQKDLKNTRYALANLVEKHQNMLNNKKLKNLITVYGEDLIAQALEVSDLTAEKLKLLKSQSKNFVEVIEMNLDTLTKINSKPDWAKVLYAQENPLSCTTVESIKKSMQSQEIETTKKILNYISKHNDLCNIWESIEPLEACVTDTLIPRSFKLVVEGEELCIAGTATKHLKEQIASNSNLVNNLGSFVELTTQSIYAQDRILQEGIRHLEVAVQKGIRFTKKPIMIGRWGFKFVEPKEAGHVVKVSHMLYESKKTPYNF